MKINRTVISFLGGTMLVLLIAAPLRSADQPYGGYLTPGEFDVTSVLPPAPIKGDARYNSDRRIFRGTRALRGTPRWELATADVDLTRPALMRNFSCAVGVDLTPGTAPNVLRLVVRAGVDTAAQTNLAKGFFMRQRPFKIDRGEICQPKAQLTNTFDYPSGHTTWGWTWALLLTDLAPDRALDILRRGRSYGESRFVCGAHNESAVEAGMQSASATLALVRTKPAFKADLETARAELAALRSEPGAAKPKGCEAIANLIQRPVPVPGGSQ